MSRWTDWLMIGIVVLQAVIAAMINSPPGELGLPDVVIRWVVIFNVGIVVLANQIKAIGAERQPPKDPQPTIGEPLVAEPPIAKPAPRTRRTTPRKES